MNMRLSEADSDERGPRTFMLSYFLRGTTKVVLGRAALMTAVIAVTDWRIEGNIPLGFLYLFPMLLVGSVLTRWQIAAAAAFCTFLTEIFDSFDWFSPAGIPRDILIFAAFFCMGLFVYEVVRSRQAALQHTHQIEREIGARSEAEEQLKILVDSSPAAVFTTDSEGTVLLANEASHRLFVVPQGTLPGRSIQEFLPSLANAQAPGLSGEKRRPIRTAMQCRGRRQNGEVFLPISGSRLTIPARDRAWRPWWLMVPKSFATARNSAFTSCWQHRGSLLAQFPMRSGMSAEPSPWPMRTFREVPRSACCWRRIKISRLLAA